MSLNSIDNMDIKEEPKKYTLERLHGTFMVLAWILSASLGNVIARYFKRTWMIWRVYKYDVWFVIHVSCMTCVWIFTIVGFILIVVDLKTINASWHSIIGIIIVIFTFVQPIAAVFGPDKGSQFYKRFYLGHFILGSILHVFAIIDIFLAINFQRVYLPFWLIYAIGSFVLFYVFSHLTFSVLDYLGNKKEGQRGMFEDKAYSSSRQIYLGLYTTVIALYSIYLIQILWR